MGYQMWTFLCAHWNSSNVPSANTPNMLQKLYNKAQASAIMLGAPILETDIWLPKFQLLGQADDK
jgi:hypothetical protein